MCVYKATLVGYVEDMSSNYSSEKAWKAALEEKGITEAEYRDEIEYQLLHQGVLATFAAEVSDEDVLAYAQENAADLYGGAKRSSHILFDADDEETAQSVLDQINEGTLDFAEAAEEYSTDSSSVDGGDVGWDALTQFVDEYQDALDELSVGEVSGLVTSEYGIHIIMCTDEFDVPDEITDTSDWPSEIIDDITSTLETENSDAQTEAYDAWLDECREQADIVINDMPENVPYNVTSTDEDEDEESDGDEAGDGAEESDGDVADDDDEATVEDAGDADGADGTETDEEDADDAE